MHRISYRFLVPGWSAKPLVSAHDRLMGTHTSKNRQAQLPHTILRRCHTNVVRRPDTSRSRTLLARRSCTRRHLNPHCAQRREPAIPRHLDVEAHLLWARSKQGT